MDRLEKMLPLTKREIYSELKKFGINTAPEMKAYLREYYTYYVLPKTDPSSLEDLTVEIKNNKPNESTIINRVSQIDAHK